MNSSEIFDNFSCKEELSNPIRDKYGRFPYYASSNRNILTPVVSEYLFSKGLKIEYPEKKRLAVCLSHDVDFLTMSKSKYLHRVLYLKALAKADFSKIKELKKYNNVLNEGYSLKHTINLEKKYDAKSSFYFLALVNGERDFNYNLDQIYDELALVKKSGCEIGLHGGHGVSDDIELLKTQKSRLEKAVDGKITGYRSHFLRFNTLHTWELLSKAGFFYDTTLGYSDTVGFRNGMCYPFSPYSNSTQTFSSIIELPLIIMDVSLFNYMNLTEEMAKELCIRLISKVEAINGVLTILWHNNNVNGQMGAFYEWLLSYLKQKEVWFSDSASVIKWYSENGYLDTINRMLLDLRNSSI